MSGKLTSAAMIRVAAIGAFCAIQCAQPATSAQPAPAASSSRSVWEGVFTIQQAKRGEAIYARECASCHGATLKEGEGATPLAGDAFVSEWNGESAGDLFERIRQTMPQTEPGKMSRQEYVDVLGHILSVNKFPPGSTELDSHIDVLKQIRIEATRAKP